MRGGTRAAITMSQRDQLLDQFRRLALQGMREHQTDGQLLEDFISERDEGAFALLVRRHGSMVWSVCRRVLGNAHDADDAFQAAFLVLVHKADTIRPREAVGNWLYGVAYRTALVARREIARQRAKEQSLHEVPTPESKPEGPWQELWPVLDRELSRLADKYRLPIVLCDLEGRSRKEVARQLAIPEGTLSSRLVTARRKLAARLARYGFAVSVASLGALLMEKTAMAGLTPLLLSSTTQAALSIAARPETAPACISATVRSLTEEVLNTMFISKIKIVSMVLCGVAALGVFTGGVYYQAHVGAADSQREIQSDQEPPSNASRQPRRSSDDWKRIAEDLERRLNAECEKAKAQEQELRLLAQKLQSEAAILRAEIEAMGKEALARPQHSPVPPSPLGAFEKMKAEQERLVNEHQKQIEDLRKKQRELVDMQTQQFATEMRQNLAEMDKRIGAEQTANQPSPQPSQKPASRDKVDQVLERLERLEKRLDRLETDKK